MKEIKEIKERLDFINMELKELENLRRKYSETHSKMVFIDRAIEELGLKEQVFELVKKFESEELEEFPF